MVFETERLRFRHLIPSDFDDLLRLYEDPEVRRFYPDGVQNPEQTREELEWFLNGHPNDSRLGLWAAIHKDTGEFMGRAGLLPWTIDGVMEIEIAYLIDKQFWRQGYGSETAIGLVRYAFETLGLRRVIALTDHDHTGSIRTAMKAGLTFEKEIEMDGLLSDVYSLTRVDTQGAGIDFS